MVGQRPHPYILRPRPWPSGHAPAGENRRLFPSVLAPGTLRGADRRKPGKAPHSGPLRLTIDLAPPHKKAIPLWQGGAPAWALAAFAGPRVASGTPPEPSPSVCTAVMDSCFLDTQIPFPVYCAHLKQDCYLQRGRIYKGLMRIRRFVPKQSLPFLWKARVSEHDEQLKM
jgi:hypothetical protein